MSVDEIDLLLKVRGLDYGLSESCHKTFSLFLSKSFGGNFLQSADFHLGVFKLQLQISNLPLILSVHCHSRPVLSLLKSHIVTVQIVSLLFESDVKLVHDLIDEIITTGASEFSLPDVFL